jgi:hypothetical protein
MNPCNSVLLFHCEHSHHVQPSTRLCDQGGSGGALVPPGRGEDTGGLVVAGQTVDTGLDENETAVISLVTLLSWSMVQRTTWSPCPCGW